MNATTGHSFVISASELASANPRYKPVHVPNVVVPTIPDTKVEITSAVDMAIELVATFAATTTGSEGINRVAAPQILDTTVNVDFNRDVPLYWMASVYRKGDLSPNVSTWPYSGDGDVFSVQLNQQITLEHNAQGWQIPSFDSLQDDVEVGFGMGSDLIAWGYSVSCSPNSSLLLRASAYELARSNGGLEVGDAIPAGLPSWQMSFGGSYVLAFDSSGVGTLTQQN
ncbi:MAG: hypothetical protein HC897_07385 [Thermoanaerobaculia bacterium]|nr:hypothetical protein [Thermoanaerobaculia bacterium]